LIQKHEHRQECAADPLTLLHEIQPFLSLGFPQPRSIPFERFGLVGYVPAPTPSITPVSALSMKKQVMCLHTWNPARSERVRLWPAQTLWRRLCLKTWMVNSELINHPCHHLHAGTGMVTAGSHIFGGPSAARSVHSCQVLGSRSLPAPPKETCE
jgi:hypothetical protein